MEGSSGIRFSQQQHPSGVGSGQFRSLMSRSAGAKVQEEAPPPTGVEEPIKTEKEQIDEFVLRHRRQSGLLVNPPGQEPQAEVQPFQHYLESIVEKLAGERLREEGLHLRVSLYSGEEVNAFMARHDRGRGASEPGEPTEGEEKPWAVRRALGLGQDGKPLYELGWNLGNFKELEHEEEVAFIVAHELAHLFENHLEPGKDLKGQARRWLSSQAHEAAADYKAVEMMAQAGFGVDAALVALDRLFQKDQEKNDPSNFTDGLIAGGSSHHHEGVRIALTQGQIELLRRQNPSVRPADRLSPLPESLRQPPQIEDPYSAAERASYQKTFHELLLGPLTSTEPFAVPGNYGLTEEQKERIDPKLRALMEQKTHSDQFPQVLVEGLEELDRSNIPPQRRVDAVLRMLYLGAELLCNYQGLEFNQEQAQKLQAFLLRNSFGQDGWKKDRYFETLAQDGAAGEKDFGSPPHLQQRVSALVLSNKSLEGPLAQLHQTNSQWQHLIDAMPSMALINGETGAPDNLEWVTDMIRTTAERTDSPLTPIHQENLLDLLGKLDLKEQVQAVETGGLGEGTIKFRHTLSRLFDPEFKGDAKFMGRVRQSLEPTLELFAEFRDSYMLDALQNKGLLQGSADGRDQALWDAFSCTEQVPLEMATRDVLSQALLSYAEEGVRGEILPPSGFLRGHSPFHLNPELGREMVDLLHSSQRSPEERGTLLTWLAMGQKAGENLPKDGYKSQALAGLQDYLLGTEPEELVELGRQPFRLPADILEEAAVSLYGVERPDFSGEGLQGFAARLNDEELEPDYKKGDNFSFALKFLPFAAEQEFNSQASLLSFYGSSRELSQRLAGKLSVEQFDELLGSVEGAKQRREALDRLGARYSFKDSRISSDAALFLMDGLLYSSREDTEHEEWFGKLERVLALNPFALDGRADYREEVSSRLLPDLQRLPGEELEPWLEREHLLSILRPEDSAQLIAKLFPSSQPGQRPNLEQLAAQIQELDERFQLSKSYPEAYQLFSQELAARCRLQPGEVKQVFPADQRSISEQAESLSEPVRGLSALVAMARNQDADSQIHLLDYLMGRREDEPEFLAEAVKKADQHAPVLEVVRHSRGRLQKEKTHVRVMVANSFLAGPNSFLRSEEGEEKLLGHLLKDVRPEHQKMARRLADALLDSQGRTDSLALAYVLGQRSERADGKMDEATVLSSLFDAYGVPGIKFKQYLAFTSEFAEFREAFESAQDSAMPLSYLDAVRLLEKRFGDQWPPDFEIDKILGSGSVNVAIRYHNPKTEKKEVVTVARDGIETATDYDFFRFNRFLDSLTNTPEDRDKFGYLLGLSDVIRESVGLELDKQAAMEIQQSVQPLYRQKVNGWNIQSVDAFDQKNMAIFMAEAKGQTARRLQQSDPEGYRQAMKALSQVEMNSLLGIDQNRKAAPVPLHANPDFHDGQVLIDPETRSVTILDFGQAVPIDNRERELGMDLLAVIGGAKSPKAALKILNEQTGIRTPLGPAAVEDLLRREEPMDAFVHLLSLVGQNGGKVPIAAVHWVMAVHRQMALGEKIGISNDKTVRNLTVVRNLGGNLKTFNRLHLMGQWAQNAGRQVLGHLGFATAADQLKHMQPSQGGTRSIKYCS